MVNPEFIDIHHFTEAKPDNKAEQISRDEFAAKYHEYTDKKTLKYFKIKSAIGTRAIINLFYCVIKMKFNRLFLTNAVRKVRL